MTTRVNPIMPKVLNDCQIAFIKGRNIMYRVMLLHQRGEAGGPYLLYCSVLILIALIKWSIKLNIVA